MGCIMQELLHRRRRGMNVTGDILFRKVMVRTVLTPIGGFKSSEDGWEDTSGDNGSFFVC